MKQLDLTKGSPRKLFLRYLLPSISATLVTSIYILADSVMIGKGVGQNGIAALNIVLPLFTFFFGTGILFGIGGAVLMSVAQGSNDYEMGKRCFTTSTYSLAVISILATLILQLFMDNVLDFLGTTDVTRAYATEYARIFVAGTPIFMFSSMLQAFVRNDKNPNLAMLGVITGGVTNIVLDYVFIYLFEMGMTGGAIATVIGSTTTVTILCSHFFRRTNTLRFVRHGYSIRLLIKIITNGFSSFLVEMAGGIVTFLFNIQLIRYIGEIGITVYSIIANTSFVVMSLANGVAQAAQPVIAVNYGAGEKERVKKVRNLGVICTSCIGILIVVSCMIAPGQITRIFVHANDEILALSIPAIRSYSIAFLFLNLNLFGSSYFQSVMKPYYAMIISVLRGLVFSSVMVMLLPAFFKAEGIWIAMPIVEIATASIMVYLMRKEK